MHTSDAALLHRWYATRDAEAFRTLVERYANLVYAAAHRVLRNSADAEDVSQACFIKLASTRKPPQRNLGAWLHTAAVNRAKDHLRAESRRGAREQRHSESRPESVETDWDDTLAQVDEAIALLDDDLRLVIVAHFLEARSQVEISQDLRVSRQTVNTRVKRGIEAIRAQLATKGIITSTAALGTVLTSQMVEAAPPTLIATLGKVSLAGSSTLGGGGLAMMSGLPVWKALGVMGLAGVALTFAVINWPSIPTTPSSPIVEQQEFVVSSTKREDAVVETEATTAAIERTQVAPETQSNNRNGLSGTVVDAEGQIILRPIHVQANLKLPEGWNPAELSTDEVSQVMNDRLRSQNIQDGKFSLEAFPFSSGKGTLLASDPETGLQSETFSFDLTQTDLSDIVVRFPNFGRLSGKLLDSDGAAIQNVKIIASGHESYAETMTDNQGRYSFDAIAPGEFRLSANASGPEDELKRMLHFSSVARSIVIHEGEDIENFDLNCDCRSMTVSGVLLDENQKGIPNTEINFRSESRPNESVKYQQAIVKTDHQGQFHFDHYGPVLLTMNAQSSGWIIEAPAAVRSGTTENVLQAHSMSDRMLHIQAVDSVTGEPVSKFKYTLQSRYSMTGSNSTDPDGKASIYVPPDEDPTLSINAGDIGGIKYNVRPEDLGGPRIRLRLEPIAPIRGLVLDHDDEPVVNAQIRDTAPSPSYADTEPLARTGSDGTFQLENLSPNVDFIYIIPSGSVPLMKVAPERKENWIIRLAEGGSIRGTVRAGDRLNTEVSVKCLSTSHDEPFSYFYQTGATNSDGVYQIDGLPAGEYTVKVDPPQDADFVLRGEAGKLVNVGPGETVTVDFNLQKYSADATLRGNIYVDGEPDSGRVSVVFSEWNDSPFPYGRSEGRHGYHIENLLPETVTVQFNVSGRSKHFPITLQSGENVLDAHFALATASLECLFALDTTTIASVNASINVDTEYGQEQYGERFELIPDSGVLMSNVPVGIGTVALDVRFWEHTGVRSRRYFREVVLEDGATTTITIGETSTSLYIEVEGALRNSVEALFLLKEPSTPEEIHALPPTEFERFLHKKGLVYQSHQLVPEEPITDLESGAYTLIALSWPPDETYTEDTWPAGLEVTTMAVILTDGEQTEAVLAIP